MYEIAMAKDVEGSSHGISEVLA